MIAGKLIRRTSVALMIAASSTLVSIRPSVAETEAQLYLRDTSICWVEETLDEATGLWSHRWDTPNPGTMRGGSDRGKYGDVPGYFGVYGYVNKTNPSEISIVVRPSKSGGLVRRLRQVPCPGTASLTGFHPFVGAEVGVGWSNTNFDVVPNFGVSGSSLIGGINGGFLYYIPGTSISVGPRIGWLGGDMSGTTANPPASPFFDYTVKVRSFFYQEAFISIPIQREVFGFEKTFLDGGASVGLKFPYVTASAGVAEARTQITGTSGAFEVTDSLSRTGFTFTGGIGIPIQQSFGGTLDAYLQYRGTIFSSGAVDIPGKVTTDYWVQGINFGVQLRY